MKKMIFTLIIAMVANLATQAADYYWVGGSGNWNAADRWATASGGSTFYATPPTSADNVYFDANSFPATGAIVTINVDAVCADMNWTGASNSPQLAGATTRKLSIYGSLTLISAMNYNFLGDVYFESLNTGRGLTSAGQTFKRHVYFNGVGGYVLQDAFMQTAGTVYLVRGTLDLNDKNMTANAFDTYYTNVRTLYLTSSTLTLTTTSTAFQFRGENLTLNAGTSLVRLTSAGANFVHTNSYGPGQTFNNVLFDAATGSSTLVNAGGSFNNVTFNSTATLSISGGSTFNSITATGNVTVSTNGTNITTLQVGGNLTLNNNSTYGDITLSGSGTINGSNTIGNLTMLPGKYLTLNSGQTQTFTGTLSANGTCAERITIQASSTNQANISKSSGFLAVNYCYLQGINGTGGASFTAANTFDLGNNSGWLIIPPSAQNLYWVGGSGNWNDPAHWSTTSGGAPGACTPSALDNVFFDANSFTASGQTVTVVGDANGQAYCRSMNWAGSLNNPTLSGASGVNLNIYGSLTLTPGMTYNLSSPVYFKAETPGNNIFTAGKALDKANVSFDGVGGEWTLQDPLSMGTRTLYLIGGTLNTNNHNISAGIFNSYANSKARALNLGSSQITLSNGGSAFYFRSDNFTLNAGTSHLRFTAAGGDLNHNSGAGVVFNNVSFDAVTGTSVLTGYGCTFNNVTFSSNGSVNGGNTISNLTFAGNGTISTAGNNINTIVFGGTATINQIGTYGHVTMNGNGSITANNTFGTLIFSAGKQYTLTSGRTITIVDDLIADGTESQLIVIKSSTVNSQATFSKATGAVTVNYVSLQDNNATGGATFTANNSVDLGNNTGWVINSVPRDYYWVGGSGNYNDPAKWSLTSGGAGGAGVPTAIDNVFFDASSFTAPGQTVTIVGDASGNARAKNMNWTGTTNNPTLAGASTQNIRVYGSLTLIPGMTVTFAGTIYFEATETGQVCTTAGVALGTISGMYFQGDGGGWTLTNELNISSKPLYLVLGSLNTNNQTITAGSFNSNYSGNVRSLNLGSSEIILSSTSDQTLRFHPTGMTFNAGTSLILFTGAGSGIYNVSGSGLLFNDVIFEAVTGTTNVYNDNGAFNSLTFNSNGNVYYTNTINTLTVAGNSTIGSNNNNFNTVVIGGNVTISGNTNVFGHFTMNGNGTVTQNNTFGTLVLTAGKQYTFTSGRTQTFLNDLIAEGTETELIVIKSSTAGSPTTFSKTSGAVEVNYVSLQDNSATGGATFTAYNSVDLGGNSGWTILSSGSKDYYWVGGTGNWNEASNWSLVSGDTGGAGIPTANDNVFFDANSFSSPGQVVTIIGDVSNNARVVNMDWTGAAFNPTLAGASNQNLRISGSMILSPGMSVTFAGTIYFEALEPGKTLTMAGVSLGTIHSLYFQGEGGGWTLMDGLNIGDKFLYLVKGSLNTNNQPVTAGIFNSDYSGNVRSLTLGSSEITLNSSSGQSLRFHPTGMTFDAGTSLIRFTGSGAGIYNLSGSGLFFHNVIFEATTGQVDLYNKDGGFNNIIFQSTGTSNLRYSNTVNSVTFAGTGGIHDDNTIAYAKFNGNGTITGNNTFGTLEFTPGYSYTLTNGKTQIINDDLIAHGTCPSPITIQSNSITNRTTLSKSSGTITINQVSIQGLNATGGATFIANNAIDLGNNLGWTINLTGIQNLYWVGGTGNWNDVSHWSDVSGGAGGYCLPTQLDNVIFDQNSFTQNGQAVYMDIADASCRDMDWSAVTFAPTFTALSNTYKLNIYGSLVLSQDMNFAFNGPVYFVGEAPAKSTWEITMAGKNFSNAVYFEGEGGIWRLLDNFGISSNDLYLNKGTLNTDGKELSVRRFISDNNNIRALNFGSSVIDIGSSHSLAWFVTGSNFTINPGTSEIRFTAANGSLYSLGASNLTYHNVVFLNPGGISILRSDDQVNNITFQPAGKVWGDGVFNNVIFYGNGEIDGNNSFGDVTFFNNALIQGSNSFSNLTLSPGKLCQMQAGQTQTIINDLNFWGNADNPITLQSATTGSQAVVSKASGVVSGNYILLKDMFAAGGATFNVYNSTDQGNNDNWNFLEPPFATCPEDFSVCVNLAPFELNQALPTGWVYSGDGVYYDNLVYMFDPEMVSGAEALITYTIGGLFPGSCNFSITILPLPVADCRDDIEVCAGSGYITLYEGFGNYYFNGDPITGFDPLNPGTFTITYTVTNECGDASCDFYINVLPLPEATISGDLEICQGETTTLTASAGTEYLWSTDETTQSIVVGVAGDYSVTVKGENGCENSAEVTVTVHPLPVVTISGDLEICQGESTTLTSSLGSSYLWSTSETTRSIEVSAGGLYSVEVTDANGCKNTAQVTVVVHPLPVVTISGDLEICQGESTTLTASLGSSYLWSTGETTRSIDVSTGGLYSVEVTDANGCKNTAQVTVIVHPLPVIEITGELAFCEGQSTVLTATAGASYEWSTNEVTQSITVFVAGDYSVMVTDANGCEGFDEVTVSYLEITIPTCPDDIYVIVTDPPFALAGGLPEGGTYSGAGVTNGIFDPSIGVGNYPITYIIDDVCGPQSCEFLIIVSEEPITCEDAVISNFPAVVEDVCYDESYSVDFSGVVIENAIEVIWTVIPAEAGVVENNIFVLNPGILDDVTIQLLAVAEDPCEDAQASVGFTVKPLPNYFCEFSDTEICSGEEVTFTHNFEGVAPWTLEYYLGGVLMSFTTSENPYVVTQSFTETTYFEPVHIYSGNGCDEGVSQFTTIEVYPLPTFTYELSTTEICSGDEVTFTNYFTGTAPWTLEFKYNGVLDSYTTSDNPQVYAGTFTETILYEPVSVTDGNGCSSPVDQPATITVNPLPTFTREISDTEICYGDEVTITDYFTGEAPWTMIILKNGETFSFPIEESPAIRVMTLTETLTYEIVSVTDNNGCVLEVNELVNITVYPLPEIEITGDLEFCEGQSTVLTATEGASYDWSTGESTQSITVSIAGDYSVTVTDGNGCEGFAEVMVSYLETTIPTCPGNMNVLVTDAPFVLTGGLPEGGTYSGVGISGNIFDPATVGVGNFPITYLIEDVCGPQSCEFWINVTEEPILCEDASISNFPASAEDVCEGEEYTIDFSGVVIENAVNEIWTVNPVEAGGVVGKLFTLNIGYVGDVTISLFAVAEEPCEDAQASVGFTVFPLPTFTHEISDSEICSGEEVTITDHFTGAAPWEVEILQNGQTIFFAVEQSPAIRVRTFTETTTWEIVSVTDGNGCTIMVNEVVTITVFPLPSYYYELSDTEICLGDEVVYTNYFTGTAPWTVEFYSNGELMSFTTSDNPQTYTETLTETTTFEPVSVTDGNGCSSPVDQPATITVNPLPTIATDYSSTEVCYGETIEFTNYFTGTPPWTVVYEYNGVQDSFTTFDNPDYYSEIFYETTINEIKSVTDGNGCSIFYTDNITIITVYPLPEIEISGELEFCEGQSTILTATAGASYDWSNGESTQSITVTMAGLYSVVVIDENGCEGYAEVTTSYLPVTIPTCPANMNVLITDAAFTITGEDPMGGIYSGAGVVGTNVFDPALAGLGEHSISYTIEDICGPQSCMFTITVSEEPITCEDASISNFPALAEDVCENEEYTIDFSGVLIENAVSEIWTVNPVEAGVVVGRVFTLNMGFVGEVTISLLAVALEPCEDAEASVGFIVNPLPTFIHEISDTEICFGEEVTIIDYFTGTAPWTMTILEDGETYSFPIEESPAVRVMTPTETLTYEIVSVTDNNGCTLEVNELVIITVNPLPTFSFELSATELCYGEELIWTEYFTGTPPWTVEFLYNGEPDSFITYDNPETFTEIVTESFTFEPFAVIDGNGCTAPVNQPVAITVNPLPTFSFELSSTVLCYGEELIWTEYFTGTPPWTVEFLYNGALDSFTTYDNPETFTEIVTESFTFEPFAVTDGNGCTAPVNQPVAITLNPLPTFEFEVSETEICAGDPVVFTNIFTGQAPWTVAYTYNGVPGSFTTSENPEFFTEYFNETTTYITQLVTDGNGCSAELNQEVTITVIPAPEVFCPADMEVFNIDPPVLLNEGSPAGGTYSGIGVFTDGNDFYFDPSTGIGVYEIVYCVEDVITGCSGCCSFMIEVLPVPGEEQIICMPAGWTGISSYFIPDIPQLETIFAGLNAENKTVIMLGENGIYWPGQNVNTLGNWDVYKGYKIKMNEPGCIEIEGEMPMNKSFAVKKGSSFIPMLCDQPVPAAEIFGQLGNNLLFAFDLHSQKVYWPQGGIFTLDFLEPGKGYLVNIYEQGQITFNCAKSSTAGYVPAQLPVYQNAPWSFNRSDAAHFISISTAALNELENGDFISVFNSDGTCAGFARYNGEKSNLLLVAYGDDFTTDIVDGLTDLEAMSFRVFRQSTITEIAADVVFDASMPDAGDYREQGQSKIISIKAGTTAIGESKLSSIRLHPNPSNGLINLIIPEMDESITIAVTSIEGQIVYSEKPEISTLSHQLDLTGVNPGVYFVRITANGQTVMRKIVIQ